MQLGAASSGSIAMQPLTWKPPMQTGMPAARNGRAISTARGKLVGLHTDQADQPVTAVPPDLPDDSLRPDASVGLVPDGDPDLDVVTQDLTLRAVAAQARIAPQAYWRESTSAPTE